MFTQPRECTRHLDTRFTLVYLITTTTKHMLQSLSPCVWAQPQLRCYSGSFESVIQEWALVVSLTDDWEPNQSPLLICTREWRQGVSRSITPNATLPGRTGGPAPGAGLCAQHLQVHVHDHELGEELQGCSWQVLPEQMGTLAHWAGVTLLLKPIHLKYPRVFSSKA